MNYLNYLCQLEDGSICVCPNYKISITKNKHTSPVTIVKEIKHFLDNYGIQNKFIVLLSLNNMDPQTSKIDLFFYKKLKQILENNFPDKLCKLIIYDYSEKYMFFFRFMKLIAGQEYWDKIIIDKNYKVFVDKMTKNDNIIVNNNELHY